jgi:hypothetical protein
MTQDEIDTMWQQAMRESIKDGEMFTRYHFAKLVAAKEREACAKKCEEIGNDWKTYGDEMKTYAAEYLANAIRARVQA